MAEDADNLFWGPVENGRTLLANSATFQTLVDEETAEAAKGHIYIPAIDHAAVKAARPFAIVASGDKLNLNRTSTTNFSPDGSLTLFLEADVPEAHLASLEAAETWFCALIGDILTDILTLSNDEGYLAVNGVRLLAGPMRADEKIHATEGDFYQVIVALDWGAW